MAGVDGFGIFLVGLAMVVGILGTLLPFLPGLPIVWAAALVYGLGAGFGAAGWVFFILITLIGLAGLVVGTILPHRRAAGQGAPTSTIVIGIAVGIVGLFVIPIIGLPIGAGLGVLLAERRRLGDWPRAWTATKQLMIGFGIGALIQFCAGVAMLGVWVVWVIVG